MNLNTIKLAVLRAQVLSYFGVNNTKALRKKLATKQPQLDLSAYVFTRKAAWIDLIAALNIPINVDVDTFMQVKTSGNLKAMKQRVFAYYGVTSTKQLRPAIAAKHPGAQMERFDFRKKHYWQVLIERIEQEKHASVSVAA